MQHFVCYFLGFFYLLCVSQLSDTIRSKITYTHFQIAYIFSTQSREIPGTSIRHKGLKLSTQCSKFTLFLHFLPPKAFQCTRHLGHGTTACRGQTRAPGPHPLGDRQLPPSAQSHSDRSDGNGHKREEKPSTSSSKNGFKNQWNSQEAITTFKSLVHSMRNNVSKTAEQMRFFGFLNCASSRS